MMASIKRRRSDGTQHQHGCIRKLAAVGATYTLVPSIAMGRRLGGGGSNAYVDRRLLRGVAFAGLVLQLCVLKLALDYRTRRAHAQTQGSSATPYEAASLSLQGSPLYSWQDALRRHTRTHTPLPSLTHTHTRVRLDTHMYSRYPTLIPPLVLPGPPDLPETMAYLQKIRKEVDDEDKLIMQELQGMPAKRVELWSQKSKKYDLNALADRGCAESLNANPDLICEVQCNSADCNEGRTLCQQLQWCSHVAVHAVKVKGRPITVPCPKSPTQKVSATAPACTQTRPTMQLRYYGTLKRVRTPGEIDRKRERKKEREAMALRECMDLGRAVDAIPEERELMDSYEEEKALTSQLVRERKTPLLLAHIQKAAGTTMCELAKDNLHHIPALQVSPGDKNGRGVARRESFGILGKNCNPFLSDISDAWYGPAAKQVEYVRARRWNFFANEKFLGRELPYKEFGFLTVLRHPFNRLLSHYFHFTPEVKDFHARRSFVAGSLMDFLQLSEDNFMTRRLCAMPPWDDAYNLPQGPTNLTTQAIQRLKTEADKRSTPVRGSPPGKFVYAEYMNVTRRNLECAKDRLRRFNVVLTSESLWYSNVLLRDAFGWNIRGDGVGTRGTSSSRSSSLEQEVGAGLTPELVMTLRERHALDLELYAYAKALMCRALVNRSNATAEA